MTDKFNFEVENKENFTAILDLRKDNKLRRRASILPTNDYRFGNKYQSNYGSDLKASQASLSQLAGQEKKMNLFLDKCSASVTSIRSLLEVIITLSGSFTREEFLKILNIEAPKIIH